MSLKRVSLIFIFTLLLASFISAVDCTAYTVKSTPTEGVAGTIFVATLELPNFPECEPDSLMLWIDSDVSQNRVIKTMVDTGERGDFQENDNIYTIALDSSKAKDGEYALTFELKINGETFYDFAYAKIDSSSKCVNYHFSGNSADKLDIVLVGDTAEESNFDDFEYYVGAFSQALLSTEPFKTYSDKINIHYSTDLKSKICTVQQGGGYSGACKLSSMDLINAAIHCPMDRIVVISEDKFRSRAFPGSFAVVSASNPRVTACDTVHELGHSFGLLGDEYIEESSGNQPRLNCSDGSKSYPNWNNLIGEGEGNLRVLSEEETQKMALSHQEAADNKYKEWDPEDEGFIPKYGDDAYWNCGQSTSTCVDWDAFLGTHFRGCSYIYVNYRPTLVSIMKESSFFCNDDRWEIAFGPYNIKKLTERLGEYE